MRRFMFFTIDKKTLVKLLLVTGLTVFAFFGSRDSVATVFSSIKNGDASPKKLPIYCVETEEKKLSISFDAAWGVEDTPQLLQILKDNDVKATFFVCGYWVDKYPEAVKQIIAEGHDIGNHGDTHAHGAKLSLDQNYKEIMGVHDKIKNLTGVEMNLFRAPYGEYNDNVLDAAAKAGYYTIQWDVDSHDWMEKGEQYQIDRVLKNKNLSNGSIVLFHNDTKYTPKTLDTIIKGLKEQGYTLVPISELIIKDDYYIDRSGRQKLNKQ